MNVFNRCIQLSGVIRSSRADCAIVHQANEPRTDICSCIHVMSHVQIYILVFMSLPCRLIDFCTADSIPNRSLGGRQHGKFAIFLLYHVFQQFYIKIILFFKKIHGHTDKCCWRRENVIYFIIPINFFNQTKNGDGYVPRNQIIRLNLIAKFKILELSHQMRILHAWNIKSRQNKKLITYFACKLRDESNESNYAIIRY